MTGFEYLMTALEHSMTGFMFCMKQYIQHCGKAATILRPTFHIENKQ